MILVFAASGLSGAATVAQIRRHVGASGHEEERRLASLSSYGWRSLTGIHVTPAAATAFRSSANDSETPSCEKRRRQEILKSNLPYLSVRPLGPIGSRLPASSNLVQLWIESPEMPSHKSHHHWTLQASCSIKAHCSPALDGGQAA